MKILTFFWRALASIDLTIILCLLLTADLVWGYFLMNGNTSLFSPLNDMGLWPWLRSYGRYNLAHTGWFFLLLPLLTLLALNTFACTTSRVLHLLAGRASGRWRRLAPQLAPHIMHYGLIIILTGYLASYLCSHVLPGITLTPGSRLSLPGAGDQVILQAFEPVYYHGDRLDFMKDEVIDARAQLLLDDGAARHEATLTFTRPVWFGGYSLHLLNFAPKSLNGGMKLKTRIDLHVRKDPGVTLYLAGIALFTMGLLLYLYDWIMPREAHR